MANESSDALSPQKRALIRIRELKQQLAEAEQRSQTGTEPVAVVSMACRFPRTSRTPEAYWQSLLERTDQVSEVPADRWDLPAFYDADPNVPGKMYAKYGVFLDSLDLMDPEFFGISPREATWVDPQQRLLMEVSWETMERAGWRADAIAEETGVFVGWMHNDYQNEASDSFLNLNPYIATGAAGSFLCGRLAYYLGLQGPSVAIDTACSSSLVALHLACQSLQRRECNRALVGGVNAICSPTTNILTCKLKALSPQGHSRAFDADADGYLRGEGCGVIAIRRLADALEDGDPILGVIRGTAVGHNGFSSGLTAPNPTAQTRVIRKALEQAGISPSEVSYLEAHGTGTELGDPIEMQAAAEALATDRDSNQPLLVGSVKTNIGHLEAAAGMAGLIKVMMALNEEIIPPQLNFDTPNPHIAWDKLNVKVLTEPTSWPSQDRKLAGVSAFGMSGTNAHVVVENFQADRLTASHSTPVANRQPDPQLIVLSAKSEEALEQTITSWDSRFASSDSKPIADIGYSAAVRRTHFDHRVAIIASTFSEAKSALNDFARQGKSKRGAKGHAAKNAKVVWQFTGQGSQYVGMGRQLFDECPSFKESLLECDSIIRSIRNESLLDVMFEDSPRINDTTWTQPAIFALQKGLVRWLNERGFEPDMVLGHSVGQYAAACSAGIMSWADGLRLIAERGRLIGSLPQTGKMLAVFGSNEQLQDEVNRETELSIAAWNGTHTVISGETDAVERVKQKFADQGVRCVELKTSHAFHSAAMDPILKPFEEFAAQFEFTIPAIPIISNVTGEALPANESLTPEAWSTQIRKPVCFSQSIQTAQELGADVILELGPQSTLTQMARAIWEQEPEKLVATLQRGVDDQVAMKQSAASLFVFGKTPDFANWPEFQAGKHVDLPTYPFQRRRFWGPDKPRAAHSTFHTSHPLLGSQIKLAGSTTEQRFENHIEADSPAWLPDHQVMGQTVFPGAGFVEMALAASKSRVITDLAFEQPLRPHSRTALQSILHESDESSLLEVHSLDDGAEEWVKHFRATLDGGPGASTPSIEFSAAEATDLQEVSPELFYETLGEIGLDYGPQFQTIKRLKQTRETVVSQLSITADIRGYLIPPPLLDGAFHSLAAGLLRDGEDDLFLPIGLDRVNCQHAIEGDVTCVAKWRSDQASEPNENAMTRVADLALFDEQGKRLAELQGLQVRRIDRASLRKMSGGGSSKLIYEMKWEPARLPAPTDGGKRWIIVSDESAHSSANSVGAELAEQNHQVVYFDLQRPTEGDSVSSLPDLNGTTENGKANASASQDGTNPLRLKVTTGNTESWVKAFQDCLWNEEPLPPQGLIWFVNDAQNVLVGPSELNSLQNASQIPLGIQNAVNGIKTLLNQDWKGLECGLTLVTRDALILDSQLDDQLDSLTQSKSSTERSIPLNHLDQAAFWGLGRVLSAEHPELRCRLCDVSSAEFDSASDANSSLSSQAKLLTNLIVSETEQSQFAIRDQQFVTPKLARLSPKMGALPLIEQPEDSTYLITGGLGQLGRAAIDWLLSKGAKHLTLLSRRPLDDSTKSWISELEAAGCELAYCQADATSLDEMSPIFARFGKDLPTLKGVIHTAGVLDDRRIEEQDEASFAKVLAPKRTAASLLHHLTLGQELEFFILYSSVASILGSPGQSNYASGNAYLDGLAQYRKSIGQPALSINWGPWSLGMADDERIRKQMKLQGMTPLEPDEAHRAMELLLQSGATQATVLDVDWQRLGATLGSGALGLIDRLVSATSGSKTGVSDLVGQLRTMEEKQRREMLLEQIAGSLQRILSSNEPLAQDRPLIEMGLDSLMAVEFSTELQMMLGDSFPVAPTMLFDHPSVDAIVDHVMELIGESESTTATADSKQVSPGIDRNEKRATVSEPKESIAIVGLSCRFPGAEDLNTFWDNLANQVDSVRSIPEWRWPIAQFYSEEREPGKMYTREGGFIPGIDEFDAGFFHLSDPEACWMDPQHRMLLEQSYLALEHAGIPDPTKTDPNVGVFMGIMGQDYAFIPQLDQPGIIESFQGAGLSHSAGVGRISYWFGFEGPSLAIDTASSSSLVALIQAARSLQRGECNLALAGGVNAILAPINSLLMSQAGLLAPDGRCKSFSAAADGFGRGEGCGVVVLKRLSDAERDGDKIWAVFRGGAIVHNGFSGGITTPNGKAQSRAIVDALKDADLAANQVQYLEAHGTGTAFGDPMELNAAATVYGKGRSSDSPLLVGSVKANISHLEAAGGISGVIKTVLAIDRGELPPQLHFENPSPHLPWKRLPLKVVSEATPWPRSEEKIAAVTALGLVGTNAHVILSSPPQKELGTSASGEKLSGEKTGVELNAAVESPVESHTGANGSQNGHIALVEQPPIDKRHRQAELLTLSAHSLTALQAMAQKYVQFLESGKDLQGADWLTNIAFTTQTGRRHLPYRFGLSCTEVDQTIESLRQFLSSPQTTTHSASTRPELVWFFPAPTKTDAALAKQFCSAEPELRKQFSDLQSSCEAIEENDLKETKTSIQAAFDLVLNPELESISNDSGSDSSSNDSGDQQELSAFLLQLALVRTWRKWGLEPDQLAGFGLGQLAAAAAAGVVSVEDSICLAVEHLATRRRLQQSPKPEEQTQLVDQFESFADQFNYYPPNIPLGDSQTGSLVAVFRSLGGSYWAKQLTKESLSETAMDSVGPMENKVWMTMGSWPLPTSATIGEKSSGLGLENSASNGAHPSSSKQILDSQTILFQLPEFSFDDAVTDESLSLCFIDAMAKLYESAWDLNFDAFQNDAQARRVELPSYPFQRQRYWITEVIAQKSDDSPIEIQTHQGSSK